MLEVCAGRAIGRHHGPTITQHHDIARAGQYHRILAIPSKKSRTRPAEYFEPAEAKALLAQAGSPNGIKTTYYTHNVDPDPKLAQSIPATKLGTGDRT